MPPFGYYGGSQYSIRELKEDVCRFWSWLHSRQSWAMLASQIAKTILFIVCFFSLIATSSEAPLPFLAFASTLLLCIVTLCRKRRRWYWWHLTYLPLALAAVGIVNRLWLEGRSWPDIQEEATFMTSLLYVGLVAIVVAQMTHNDKPPGDDD